MISPSTLALTRTDVTAMYGNANDYSSASNGATETVNFAAGETTSTVSYTINSDPTIEGVETFTLALTLSGATGPFASLGSPTSSTVFIIDCTGERHCTLAACFNGDPTARFICVQK